IGPWHRQHDPDFQPDGTISLFDNRMGLGASRILSVNPATGAVSTLYEGSDQDTFYTWQRGSHEILPNGHVVVTETEAGRAFEVDPSGNRIWTFENVYDAKRNGLVNYATVLPTTYFEDQAFTRCGESIAATQTR
uniref:arylsulfotransferase family protein n=1 Tax=Pacificispira sp. TaxID=2888761 RepID=UPI003BAC64D4